MKSQIMSYIPKDIHSNPLIRVDYSPYALNQVKNILKNWIDDQAEKRKYVEWITIDWAESKDLDDAIWAEKTNYWYRLSIHISDVAEAIKKFSPLDLEALKRTTSIYRKEVINMYPPALSNDLLSLNENWDKFTLSLDIDLDNDWNFRDAFVYESKFKNQKRYDYESFLTDYIDPSSTHHEKLHLMYEIALKRKSIRKVSWAKMDYDESDRQLFIWNKIEKPHDVSKDISKRIIEEFMILANISTGVILVKNNVDAIFRVHAALDERANYQYNDGLHMALATRNYVHFTSPIRRYSDWVVHRILKNVLIRWEKSPYSREDLSDISNHINVSRTVIDILSWDIFKEKKYVAKINDLKQNAENVTSSDFTFEIRNHTQKNKRLPKSISQEIINDIKNWKISDWWWTIWVFLISHENDIKDALYKKIIQEKSTIKPKAVLSILNETRIFWDEEMLHYFKIEETSDWKNQLWINFYFKNELIFSIFDNIWKNKSESHVIWWLRQKALTKIFSHFMNKKTPEKK